MEVGARPAARLFAAAAQQLRKKVVAFREVGVARAVFVRMIRAARVLTVVPPLRRGFFGSRGVDLSSVVAAALLRVRQKVVGRRNLLEPLLGALVAGVEVRMQFLGQFPVSRADFIGRRGLGDAQHFIGVSHGASGSWTATACISELRPLSPRPGPQGRPTNARPSTGSTGKQKSRRDARDGFP